MIRRMGRTASSVSFQVLWEVGARAKQLTLLRRGTSSPCAILWLPKTPSDLKTQGFRPFVGSWWLPRCPVLPCRQRYSRFATNLRFSKRTRRVACTRTAATGSCGLCCTDSGPVGGDVCRWFSPTQYSVGTAELSLGIGPGNRAAFPEGQKLRRTFVI
jgi:hypothetical protein